MTLNGYFALKSVSGSASNGLAYSGFQKKKRFRNLQTSYAYTFSRKNVAHGTYCFWQYKVYADIRGGSLERGRQMRVGSFKMAIFASFVHCLPNISHTWLHDSFHVIRLSMTFAIFQGH